MILELSFDKAVEKICCDIKKAQQRFGSEAADKLMKRLAYLRAAPTLNDVSHTPPLRRHKLLGNYQGCFGIDVKNGLRIVLKAIDDKEDLTEIDKVKILKIEDYH